MKIKGIKALSVPIFDPPPAPFRISNSLLLFFQGMGWHPLQYILSFICPEWVFNLSHCVLVCKPYFKNLYEGISPCGTNAFTSSSQVYFFNISVHTYFHLFYADKIVTYLVEIVYGKNIHYRKNKFRLLSFKNDKDTCFVLSQLFWNFLSHMKLAKLLVRTRNIDYLSYW